MATKGSKQAVKQRKAAPAKRSVKAAETPTRVTITPPPAPPRPVPQLSLVELAERLRDDIQRSKMTHPSPWSGYTQKARAWVERAQHLVEEIARAGDTPGQRKALEALTAEVAGDADYQEARRLF